jgi:hypothetical protein
MTTGEKNGKKWTKYVVKDGDTTYNTFSENFAKVAKEAKENGLQIKITFKAGKFGNDIENVAMVERQPGEEG